MSYPEAAGQGPLESRGERVIAIEQARPWIAATAIANRLPVVAQDDDYADIPGLEVIRI